MTENLMVPTSNWLEPDVVMTVTNQSNVTGNSAFLTGGTFDTGQTWYQPYWYPYYCPVTVTSPARPIKLTLSEVERLRKAAKADAALKTILNKFTALIEITVDFN